MLYAPIVCFGFDRPHHLENMLTSLEMNSTSFRKYVDFIGNELRIF